MSIQDHNTFMTQLQTTQLKNSELIDAVKFSFDRTMLTLHPSVNGKDAMEVVIKNNEYSDKVRREQKFLAEELLKRYTRLLLDISDK